MSCSDLPCHIQKSPGQTSRYRVQGVFSAFLGACHVVWCALWITVPYIVVGCGGGITLKNTVQFLIVWAGSGEHERRYVTLGV